jgi:hypothetical protein
MKSGVLPGGAALDSHLAWTQVAELAPSEERWSTSNTCRPRLRGTHIHTCMGAAALHGHPGSTVKPATGSPRTSSTPPRPPSTQPQLLGTYFERVAKGKGCKRKGLQRKGTACALNTFSYPVWCCRATSVRGLQQTASKATCFLFSCAREHF